MRAVFKVEGVNGDKKVANPGKIIKSTFCLPCGNSAFDESVRSRKLKEDEEKGKEQITKDASKSKRNLEEMEVLAENSEKNFDEQLQGYKDISR